MHPAKTLPSPAARTLVVLALHRCEEAARDLQRFLGRAARDTQDLVFHGALFDAAGTVGALLIGLRETLISIGVFIDIRPVENSETGLTFAIEDVDHEFWRALSVYDGALEDIVSAPREFLELLLEQRRTIARLHRDLVEVTSSREP